MLRLIPPIRINHEHVFSSLILLYGLRRHYHRILGGGEGEGDVHELSRPENLVTVRECGFQENGARGLIHLVVDE